MERPPNHNVVGLGVANPIPGGIRMTTHSPIPEEFPRLSTLAGQKLPSPQEYQNLLGQPWVNTGNLHPPPNRG